MTKLAFVVLCSWGLWACVESKSFGSGDAVVDVGAPDAGAEDAAADPGVEDGATIDLGAPDVGPSEVTAPADVPVDSGACIDGAECDDGDPCTEGDSCTQGQCVGTALLCEDGLACTIDSCFDGACAVAPNPCDDGDPCTDDGCVEPQGCINPQRADLYHKTVPGGLSPPRVVVTASDLVVTAFGRPILPYVGPSRLHLLAYPDYHDPDAEPEVDKALDVEGDMLAVAGMGLLADEQTVVVAGSYDTGSGGTPRRPFIRTLTGKVVGASPANEAATDASVSTALVQPDGTVLFGGSVIRTPDIASRPWVQAYSLDQTALWEASWPELAVGSRVTAIAPLTAGGGYLVAVEVLEPGTEQEARLLKVAAGGAIDKGFSTQVTAVDTRASTLSALIRLAGGGFLGVGTQHELGQDITQFNAGMLWTARFSNDGTLITEREFPSQHPRAAVALAQLPDGRIRAVGSQYTAASTASGYDEDAILFGLDAFGNLLYERVWPAGAVPVAELFTGVAAHADGRIALVGHHTEGVDGEVLIALAEPWGAATCVSEDPCVGTPSCGDGGNPCAPGVCGATGCTVVPLGAPNVCDESGAVCKAGSCAP